MIMEIIQKKLIMIYEANAYQEMCTRFVMVQVDLPICFLVASLAPVPFTNMD